MEIAAVWAVAKRIRRSEYGNSRLVQRGSQMQRPAVYADYQSRLARGIDQPLDPALMYQRSGNRGNRTGSTIQDQRKAQFLSQHSSKLFIVFERPLL